MPDEIIEELWRAKDAIAREHDHDVRKLAAYLQTKNPGPHAGAPDTRIANAPRQIEHARGTPIERVVMRLDIDAATDAADLPLGDSPILKTQQVLARDAAVCSCSEDERIAA